MPLVLYALTAAALLWLAHRCVRPLSRWTCVILFALPFALAGYALLANRVLAPVDLPFDFVPMNWMKDDHGIVRASTGVHTDVYLQFVPWRKAAQWSLAHGEWGLWNPFTYAGEPLAAGAQAAVYWPLTWIACLLPAAQSFTFTAAINLFLAALGAFLFARELGCRELASLVCAAGWMFAGSLVLFLLVAMGGVWTYAPFLLLGVRRLVREHSIGILVFALTAMLANGHPESALFAVLIGIAYGLFERPDKRAILLALAAGVLALLLSAIHLLPFLEAVPETQEYAMRFAHTTHGLSTQHAATRVAMVFFPYLHARPWNLQPPAPPGFTGAMAGSIILGLAIYAVWRIRSRETWFFAAAFAVSVLVGSDWTPIATLKSKLVLLDMALLDRLMTGGALPLAILAALGVEEICRRGSGRAAAWTLLAWLAIITAGNGFFVRTALVSHEEVFFGRYVVLAEIVFLAAAAIALLMKRNSVPVLLALVVAQRALSLADVHKSFPREQAYPPIPTLAALGGVHEPFRIAGHGLAFPPATSTMYGIEDARGYSAMTLRRLHETFPLWAVEQPVWFTRVDDLTRPFLSFLNVRYAITWDRDPPPAGWREVARMRGSILIENTRAIERAFVPRSVVVSERDPLEAMQRETDFRERAWIEAPGDYERVNGPGTLTLRRAKLGYELDASMQSDGWIVTSAAAWPGWRAYVDGRRVKTQIANHAFVSVYVPRGNHRVRLRYLPQSFVAGRTITLAMLASVIAYALLHRRKALLERRDARLAVLPRGE